MHTNSILLFEKHALQYFKPGIKVLEIGPDSFPSTYQRLSESLSLEWHTLDMYDHPNLTYPNSDEFSFAIPSESYDIVVSGQVIEHVRKPWRWIPELARVTRTNGLVITINPVSWPYHEAPIDCWRIYPEGMKALYEDSSLEVLLSQWGSLESPPFHRYLPGRSRESWGHKERLFYEVLGRLGYPVERAYDTITVGIKAGVSVDPNVPDYIQQA